MLALDAAILAVDDIDEYRQFINSIVKAFAQNRNENAELFNLTTTYHVYAHSKSCRRYTKWEMSISFWKIFY